MADPYDLPVSSPLGAGEVSGTTRTVDMLTKPVTVIAPVVRDLVAVNEGYYIETVFSTPGIAVQGGAALYTVEDSADHFLDPNTPISPRAPGAETPLVGAKRKGSEIARVESWAGGFEVFDETRRRNDVPVVEQMMRKVANSLAATMNTRGMSVLADFITANSLTVAANGWRWALSSGVVNVDPAKTIIATLALMEKSFRVDLAGVKPDTIILHPNDLYYARITLPGSKLKETLADYGITNVISTPLQTEGKMKALKAGAVGYILFEKPLDTEEERLTSGRRGDRYNMEATPLFIANDTTAILEFTGLTASS